MSTKSLAASSGSNLLSRVINCEPDLLWSFGWGELIKYMTDFVFERCPFFCVMNLEVWNSLPQDIQRAIDEVSGDYQVEKICRKYQIVQKDRMARASQEFGIEVYQLPPEEMERWLEAYEPVWDIFIADLEDKGLPGKEFFEEYLRLHHKYSAPEYEIK